MNACRASRSSKSLPAPRSNVRRRTSSRARRAEGEDNGLAKPCSRLTQFEAASLVKRHHFEGGTAVFELNEGEHHDHIICMDCGRVEEFVDCGIERKQLEVAAASDSASKSTT